MTSVQFVCTMSYVPPTVSGTYSMSLYCHTIYSMPYILSIFSIILLISLHFQVRNTHPVWVITITICPALYDLCPAYLLYISMSYGCFLCLLYKLYVFLYLLMCSKVLLLNLYVPQFFCSLYTSYDPLLSLYVPC